jgi:carboxypeptidase PM20D1
MLAAYHRVMTSRKKVGFIAGAGLGAAAAAALRRRWSKTEVDPEPLLDPAIDDTSRSFLAHLSTAVRIRTVSFEDGSHDPGTFEEFRRFLAAAYPMVHERLDLEVVGDHTLLFTWQGSESEVAPFLLMAHQDVVPVEPGTEGDWKHDPFSGDVDDEHLWGRGALDDKGALIAILEAVEGLVTEGFEPGPTIHLLFGHDEEVGGERGAAVAAEMLAGRGVRYSFVLDEGGAVATGVVPGVAVPLALVGVGEKLSVDVEVSATGEGGHSSMPPRHTTVGRVAAAVRAIEDHPMPARFDAQRGLFQVLAEVMRGPRAMLLRNLEVTRKVVERAFGASPQTNALIRTTSAATIVEGGIKSNVLPQEARAIVNLRVMPGDTVTGVLDHIRSVVGDEVRVSLADTRHPGDPSPLSPIEGGGWAAISDTVAEVFPGARPTPWILFGATDSRYFTPIADGVYRFVPFSMTGGDLSRVHGTGERIRLSDAARAVAFYRRLIVRAGGID